MSISSDNFIKLLKNHSFYNVAGVPDSTFGELFNKVDEDVEINYYLANREDTALGLASGISISNKNCCVLMQNSGIGNIINPLTSFNLLYNIPVLLMIGWRGYGGKPNDAPEHWIMGEKTEEYFKMLGIPICTFEDSEKDSKQIEKKLISELGSYDQSPNIKALIIKSGVIL